MSSENGLVILGEWDQVAKANMTGEYASGLTGAGTTNADALPMPAGINVFSTVAANAGAILKNEGAARKVVAVVAPAVGPLKVYPPVGGTMDGAAGFRSIAVGKSAMFFTADGMNWISILSA
jgi:hypothetical protein